MATIFQKQTDFFSMNFFPRQCFIIAFWNVLVRILTCFNFINIFRGTGWILWVWAMTTVSSGITTRWWLPYCIHIYSPGWRASTLKFNTVYFPDLIVVWQCEYYRSGRSTRARHRILMSIELPSKVSLAIIKLSSTFRNCAINSA